MMHVWSVMTFSQVARLPQDKTIQKYPLYTLVFLKGKKVDSGQRLIGNKWIVDVVPTP